MGKPKVLFILHLPPPMHGAAMMGSYIRHSKVINNDFEADFVNLATNKILSQSGKGSLRKIFTFSSLISRLTKALSRKKYDLCYITLTAQGAGFYKDALIVSIVKMWNKKIIYHFHNKGISLPKNKFTDLLYRHVFKNTKSILLSRYLYPDIQQYVKQKDVFYCPNGIPELPVSTNPESKPESYLDECCNLLFLSNMMYEKGIFVLLDACELLITKKLHFKCHFVGGWLNVSKEEFENQIRNKNLSGTAVAYGPKYDEEKLSFYRQADIFVFPTFYDTFPLVCLEAMQNGLAVVSTPEGGIPEIVIDGETGFLVPQHDAVALSEKLTMLIEQPELRSRMKLEGKKRFEQYFTLDVWERNISDILKQTIYQN